MAFLSTFCVHIDERHGACLGVRARPQDAQRKQSKALAAAPSPRPRCHASSGGCCLLRLPPNHRVERLNVSHRLLLPRQCHEADSVSAFIKGLLSMGWSSLMRHRQGDEKKNPGLGNGDWGASQPLPASFCKWANHGVGRLISGSLHTEVRGRTRAKVTACLRKKLLFC